jgi:sugar lactone lactonase YvrE
MRFPRPVRFVAIPWMLLGCVEVLGQTGNYPYVLGTFAGSFPLGDGGPATKALLYIPSAVVQDAAGNLFILDSANYRIRKIDTAGNISTAVPLPVYCYDMKLGKDGSFYLTAPALVGKVAPDGTPSIIAGTGVPGTSGDGIAATSAALGATTGGIALDAAGNVYFVDGNRVREVTVADGMIHTIAGTSANPGGYNGDSRAANTAQLNAPWGIAIDNANNVYIADQLNSRVRKVTASTGLISTVAGSGTVGVAVNGPALSTPLGYPYGLTLDSAGNIYVSDQRFNLALKISMSGTLAQMAGSQTFAYSDGPASSSYLFAPAGLAVDGSGNLFVAEQKGNRIREVTGGNLKTIAGALHYAGDGGPAASAVLYLPLDVAFDAQGDAFIVDSSNFRIREVTPDGNISTFAGTGIPAYPADGLQPAAAPLPPMYAIAVDASGALYLAAGVKVLKITSAGVVSTLAGAGTPGDTGDGGPATKATFQFVTGVAVDPAGNVYIADAVANRIRKVSAADGTIAPFAGTGKTGPINNGGLATAATLNLNGNVPIAIDAIVNVYFGDGGHNIVRMVAPNGIISTPVGNGTVGKPSEGAPANASPLSPPVGLAFDASGTLYIASGIFYSVYSVDAGGAIHVLSGSGTAADTDGALANSTLGFGAKGIRLDANGDLYVADTGDPYVGLGDPGNTIRRLILNSPSGLTITGGNNQTAPPGSALLNALTVLVNGRGGVGVAGVTVDFTVTSGSATLSAASSESDPTGTAGVGLTFGTDADTVVITATVDGSSLPGVQFMLTAAAN